MNSFKADLHCHSTCSDGTFTPLQLIRHAKDIGLSALSITDHDTVEAYSAAFPIATEAGIELLTGVEFSATEDEVSVHTLGYGFDPSSPDILSLCKRHTERRYNRNLAILHLLKKNGMPITEEELAAVCENETTDRHTIGRPHIAMSMLKKGYVTSIPEAFKKFLSEGKPCYAQGETLSIEETLDAIHRAHGLAVIAHPHLLKSSKTLKRLLEMDFDGIECYYGNFPLKDHQRWLKIAANKGWLITGGSDFHGEIKPHSPLGCSWIDETLFRNLQQKLKK